MIFLLYGEDSFLIEQFIKKQKKAFGELENGINFIQIDENNVENLISDIETPAFGYDKKLIIAKNTNLFVRKNAFAEKIADYLLENQLENVELIFVEEKAEKNKLFNTVSKIGTVKEFQEMKLPELVAQVKSITKAYGVTISDTNARYFIECAGTNMQDIINEIRKLIEFAGKGNEVQKIDIDSLTIKKTESVIFDLTDNLGKKETKKAIEILHNLEYNKEPAQIILIMLYRHFKKLYIVHLCKATNLIQNLKLKPNQTFLTKKYTEQARYFEEQELKTILQEMINLDEKSKNGNLDLELGLEAILMNYCSK